ncbi:hypothetical protein [Deinococcus multiflagellatus]|uniref:Uncharacterized protein n=1 Tax=Deinococcus multiflagellatus TaxID=1656887 RepID=A0ABW1ZGB3_9DEIO|nr:hypothetical protein [Deinococcus multiflagellatus]MBZ9712167.1 hypothetical protein [Deinococcus multiflagellatus]
MANPNPDTSGLRPGEFKRQKGPGQSVRLSAYLEAPQQARLAAHMAREKRDTPYKVSREHAHLLTIAQDLLAAARGESPENPDVLDLIRRAAAHLDSR